MTETMILNAVFVGVLLCNAVAAVLIVRTSRRVTNRQIRPAGADETIAAFQQVVDRLKGLE